MKKIVLGILAHVDAGKTTLSEAMLYTAGITKTLGRVDRGDAYLDTHSLEKKRGITIFSKQAVMEYKDTAITLLDTPGHVDFSCEAERTLWVQDYAILVVSASEGVRPHTKTLWQLLAKRGIPTFIFVNKCDLFSGRRAEILENIKMHLSPACVDFTADESDSFYEDAASHDTALMEKYFADGVLEKGEIARAIKRRKIFPCLFGAALKNQGVDMLMDRLNAYTLPTPYSESLFGARVFKITRDGDGRRIAFAKITGGVLRPKEELSFSLPDGTEVREKIEEIRVFSAEKSKPVKEAAAGALVALYGTERLAAGTGLGVEAGAENLLTPVLDYCMLLPDGVGPVDAFARIRTLAEEDPALDLHYDGEAGRIRVRLMGEIQLEVLKTLIEERFSLSVGFDEGTVLYRETLAAPVMGYGHFEPLRHYAEVHLLIEPLPVGSGIVCTSDCSTDDLALSWQRLVLTHIEERAHRGALLGAPLTDVRITLVRGKAHLKHTQGGDFRQATYRAVRQGVRSGEGVILEPTFDFTMELPAAAVGRALNDIAAMGGTVTSHTNDGGTTVLVGNAPVVCLRSYPTTLRAYTKGEGKISLAVGPYAPCHNPEEVIAARGYDPDLDERHTADSVFCKQGSGYAVPWYEAKGLMHLETERESAEGDADAAFMPPAPRKREDVTEKEWVEIFERTYGKIRPRTVSEKRVNAAPAEEKRKPQKPKPPKQEYLVLDGYNVIFAMPALCRLARADIGDARDALIRTVCNLAAMKKCRALIVFDAYRRKEGGGSEEEIGPVTVVYTKEKQTADAFIEKTTYHIAQHYRVRVVSSDKDEQFVILGHGALRVSVREFEAELRSAAVTLDDYLHAKK